LEVAHPFPAPLDSSKARTQLAADTMLTGRNYSGGAPVDDVLSFADTPHALIAGTTGSGKSTLLRMMVSTLAINTSPDALRLYLVDLKNTDLKPFRSLPHTELFAGEDADALRAIRIVHREVKRRKDAEDIDAPRIVLVIDELAEVGDRDTLDLLSSILRIGRSFRVNVVAATQLPTKATCGEKNNYTVRFVGAVTDAQTAALAAGRGDSGAHLLPGKGAFLRVEGTTLARLQAYHLDMAGTADMVQQAVQRWGRRATVPVYQYEDSPISAPYWPTPQREIVGGTSGTRAVQAVEVVRSVPAAVGARWPIPDRPLTAVEAAAVRRMYGGGLPHGRSKNSVITEVWGDLSNKPKRLDWLNQAIEGGVA
jgi:energy-coupling factor transporter ATP-binding protein EcfA2